MSGMADEMARHIAEDAGAGLPGGSVPGTEEVPTPPTPPPAEALNTDTGQAGPPETVPYARFKEVNDRLGELRGFEELTQVGYDVDSLRRLAAFESQYLREPVQTWAALANDLDLPEDLREAVLRHAQGPTDPPPEPPPTTPQPASALSEEDKARLNYVDHIRQRDDEETRQQNLATVISYWDRLDEENGVRTPERTKLAFISATAAGANFQSFEDLAKAAHGASMEFRDDVLGGAVRRTEHGVTPQSVPGSVPSNQEPLRPKSLDEANRMALADIEAGRLRPLQA